MEKIKKVVLGIIIIIAVFYVGFIGGYHYSPDASKIITKYLNESEINALEDFWMAKSKTKKIDNYWFLWPKDTNNNSIWIYQKGTAKPIVMIEDDNLNGIINNIVITDKNEDTFHISINEENLNFKGFGIFKDSTNEIFVDRDFDCKFEGIDSKK